jgi:hypothetical protein
MHPDVQKKRTPTKGNLETKEKAETSSSLLMLIGPLLITAFIQSTA